MSGSPTGRRRSPPSASPMAAPICCSAATCWWPPRRMGWQRSKAAGPARWSTRTRRSLADSSRIPISNFLVGATHEALTEAAGADLRESARRIAAGGVAARDSIGANLFLLGFAWQKGLVPLSGEALDRAIELNGIAIDFNRRAFLWGRHAAIDLPKVEELAMPRTGGWTRAATLDELIKRRVRDLAAYQDAAYAARYRELVGRIRRIEADRVPGRPT